MQDEREYFEIDARKLMERAHECQVKVERTMKTMFKHKRFVIDIFLGKKQVGRSLRRYNDFEAFHEVLSTNYRNMDLGMEEFPSKYQLIGKDEKRRQYFQKLLNAIIRAYCDGAANETNQRLINTMYVFLTDTETEAETVRTRRSSADSTQQKLSVRPQKSFNEQEPANLQLLEPPAARKRELSLDNVRDNSDDIRQFNRTLFLIQFQGQKVWKERYLKMEGSNLLIYKHRNDNNFKTRVQLYQIKAEYLHRQRNLLDHFCEKMQFNNWPTYTEDQAVISLSHEYDHQKLLITTKAAQNWRSQKSRSVMSQIQNKVTAEVEQPQIKLQRAMELLMNASKVSTVKDKFAGLFNPIGKVLLIFYKIRLNWTEQKNLGTIFLRIRTSGFEYESKKMLAVSQSLLVKQAFLIPISSSFENIIIDVMLLSNQSFIRGVQNEQCVGRFKIPFADYLSYPHGYGLKKTSIRPELPEKPTNPYETIIEISVKNISHFSSIYADSFCNENDGIMLNGLQSPSDTDELVITVDRVLRVLGNIALFITAFWRNVYLFKYPRLGSFFFSCLILLFLFGDAGTLFGLILSSLLLGMIYNVPYINYLTHLLLAEYLFKHIHTNFDPPQVLTKKELKFLKWSDVLKQIGKDYTLRIDGKIEKKEQAKKRKETRYYIEKHGKIFIFREDTPGIIEKVFEAKTIVELVLRLISCFINTVQKICNLFLWVDFRRSFIILFLLLLISNIANAFVFRAIGSLFCVHRLIKGKSFYEKKLYPRNRKLAIYTLRYIMNKHFSKDIEKRIELRSERQIERDLTDIQFPVSDQERCQLLKIRIEELIGVFIDIDQLNAKADKGTLSLLELIKMIQTCESRLKLEWISGKEGTSNEFQELKRLTKEEPIMDLWLQSLLINFVLNMPSQLYTTFRRLRSQDQLPYENYMGKKKFTEIRS